MDIPKLPNTQTTQKHQILPTENPISQTKFPNIDKTSGLPYQIPHKNTPKNPIKNNPYIQQNFHQKLKHTKNTSNSLQIHRLLLPIQISVYNSNTTWPSQILKEYKKQLFFPAQTTVLMGVPSNCVRSKYPKITQPQFLEKK